MTDQNSIYAFVKAADGGKIDHVRDSLFEFPDILNAKESYSEVLLLFSVYVTYLT